MAGLRGQFRHAVQGRFHHGGQLHAGAAQFQAPLRDARHFHQIVDQVRHVRHLPAQHVAGPAQLRIVQLRQAQHFQHIAHGRQRIAQLVRQGRQELVLAPVGGRQPFVEFASLLARQLQLLFVFTPVAGDKDGDLVITHALVHAAHGVEQHRYGLPVALAHVEQNFRHAALHLHQRQPVRLVEHAPTDGQQVLQFLFPEHFRGAIAEPAAKGDVRLHDGAVGRAQQQAAGRVLEQATGLRQGRHRVAHYRCRPSRKRRMAR
ncbi:hypothetical protein D3C72_881630 [compost metagenome]